MAGEGVRHALQWTAALQRGAITSLGPRGACASRLRPCAFELQPYASRLRPPYVQVASHNEPDEYELSVAFDNEPEADSEAAATLVNLFGPLRPAAARAAEGKLTRQLWAQVDAFREEFMRL